MYLERKEVIVTNFLSVVGVVSRKVPQLAVKLNVTGDAGDLAGLAAVTDQADGVAAVKIEGDAAEAVLARLVPLDLRAASFKRGHTARSLVNHMTASITRLGPKSFEVMVMRSMAQTLVHELTEAAEGVAARG